MNYDEAIKYIHGTHKFGVKLGLENIRKLLELLGNPQKKLKFVHVAGTNGKGSTVAFISSILIESGYKVGVFTSPYIERFTERICINNNEIPENDLARITGIIKAKISELIKMGYNHPTEFEIVTAIALLYYYENGCDIVILEVGLGGRFDSTNIINTPLVSVITSISFDHMSILGDTLSKIAYEKAGIIKKNGDVVLYPQTLEAEEVIKKISDETNSKLHKVDLSLIELKKFGLEGQTFDFGIYTDLDIRLLGEHQLKNAAVAITACEVVRDKIDKTCTNNLTDETRKNDTSITKCARITETAIRKGISKARWKGRMELVNKKPALFIDGAHNEDGVKVMVDTLQKYFPGNKKIFIMGVLKDKDYKKMIETVSKIAYKFFTVTPSSDRSLPSKELADVIRPYCNNVSACDSIIEGVEAAIKEASQNDIICAFGSLYYIGEVRQYALS